ncbi:MAG: hypothetical protein KGQ37_03765 [Hyphomicrobiales bacterium]|nr:hypothetical protein [Hyphomicrobiales bacterium]
MNREPSAESLIKNLAAQGWDFFKEQPAAPGHDELRQKRERLIGVMRVLGQHAEFNELMEHLLDVTLRRVTFIGQLGMPREQAIDYSLMREGQNSIVAMLLTMLAEARKEKSPAPRDI